LKKKNTGTTNITKKKAHDNLTGDRKAQDHPHQSK
jgi:hypothetical protein